MMLGQLDIHMQKNEIDLNFKPHARINFKRITDLNIRAKTTKLLEEWIHVNLCDLGLGKDFLDTKTWFIKEQIAKYFKSVSSASWKNAVKTMKS